MKTCMFALVICAVPLILIPGISFGQESSDAETNLFANKTPPAQEAREQLSLHMSPEELMKLSYGAPASPADLTLRTNEEGGMTDYEAFYFSGDPLLTSFINSAIYANPAIWESEHLWHAALQKIPQATALPDPMFSVSFQDSPENMDMTMFSLSQQLPWFGKLSLKGQMALKDAEAAREQYQAQIRDIVQMVKQSYYDLAFLDESIRVTNQDKGLLEHFEEVAETRYSTGRGIQQEVIKIQAEISRDDERLQMLTQQRESAAANLNTLMNRPPQEPIATLTGLSVPEATFDLKQLYATGQTNKQELKAARYMVEKGDDAIRLAKKEYYPDFNISTSYTRVGERPPGMLDRGYEIMLGVNLPIWRSKLRAGVREAQATKLASERDYDKINNTMEFSVRDGVLRAETTSSQMRLYEKVLIPQAEQSLDSTEAAYSTGKLNALDLIDSERFLLEVRTGYAQLKTQYLKALADIERAIGAAFPMKQP